METYVKKAIKGKTMEAIFKNTDIVNIRHFKALDLESEKDYDEEKVYNYEVKVRHNEDESPKISLNRAIKNFEKPLKSKK